MKKGTGIVVGIFAIGSAWLLGQAVAGGFDEDTEAVTNPDTYEIIQTVKQDILGEEPDDDEAKDIIKEIDPDDVGYSVNQTILEQATEEELIALEAVEALLSENGYSCDRIIGILRREGYVADDLYWATYALNADWNIQAVRSGRSYLDMMPFTYDKLVEQLIFDRFSESEAEFAANYIFHKYGIEEGEMDRSQETELNRRNAIIRAEEYLEFSSFSFDSLVGQLVFEGFDKADAKYAVQSLDVDWKEQCRLSGELLLKNLVISHDKLIDILVNIGFSSEDATDYADNCNADWNEMALKFANESLEKDNLTKKEIIERLEFNKFTAEEVEYAIDNLGL